MVISHNMEKSTKSLEDSIVETTWQDKDTEYVAQSQIYKMLNLPDVDELEL